MINYSIKDLCIDLDEPFDEEDYQDGIEEDVSWDKYFNDLLADEQLIEIEESLIDDL